MLAPILLALTVRAPVVDHVVIDAMRKRHIPQAAVVVVSNGEIIWAKGYGGADPQRTRFRIGSVTKTMTATAVMQLADAGRIRLDDDVNRYSRVRVPDAYGRPVTIRQLLTHTAGFDEKLARTAARARDDVLPLNRFLERELPPRVHPPGRLIQYSNHGYVLLGDVVEKVSGEPFGSYLQRRIFEPLHMTQTRYADVTGVHGFEWRRGRLREIPPAHLQIGPAADVTSTAHDMALFMIAQLRSDPLLMRPQAFAAMHQRQFSQHPALPGVTCGFWESEYFRLHSLYHLGGVRGFASLMMLLPAQQSGIFVVNNGNDQSLGFEVVDAIEAAMFASPQEVARVRAEGSQPAAPSHGPEVPVGMYRFLRHARTTIEKLALLRRSETPAVLRGNGELQVGELTFLPAGRGTYVSKGSYERAAILGGGSYIAIDSEVLERVPWYERAGLHEIAFVVLIIVFATGLIGRREKPLVWTVSGEVKREKPARAESVGRGLCALNLVFLLGVAVVFITTGPGDIWFGYPALLYAVLVLPFVSIAVSVALFVVKPRSLLLLAEIAFIVLLVHWNLLGFRT